MSSPQEVPQSTKTPNNKKQLLADAIAFCSIVSSYFFISLTLHYNIFESLFGLALNNLSTIIALFLSYSALIIVLKLIATVLSLINKMPLENNFGSWLNSEVSFSLLNVLVISSIYIFVHVSSRAFSVEQFCHVALWLWLSQVFKFFGALFGRITGITSFNYFGKSIAVILLLGGLFQPLGFGVFKTF